MKLSRSRVTVATDDLVVVYVNTLYNLGMYNMYEEVLAAGKHNPYFLLLHRAF